MSARGGQEPERGIEGEAISEGAGGAKHDAVCLTTVTEHSDVKGRS